MAAQQFVRTEARDWDEGDRCRHGPLRTLAGTAEIRQEAVVPWTGETPSQPPFQHPPAAVLAKATRTEARPSLAEPEHRLDRFKTDGRKADPARDVAQHHGVDGARRLAGDNGHGFELLFGLGNEPTGGVAAVACCRKTDTDQEITPSALHPSSQRLKPRVHGLAFHGLNPQRQRAHGDLFRKADFEIQA
jgi:hypothetical protein